MSSTQVISDYYHSTIEKIETFLEDLTILITDQLLLINDPSITTIKSNDNNYNMSIVAEWFHSIPHVDIKLRSLPANITFDPNDNEYLESLGILVAIPGFWLILTLIFFLIFFLCRCCDGSNNNGSNSDQQKLQNQQQQQTSFHHQQQSSSTLLTSKTTTKPRKLTGCKFCLALFALIATIIIVLSLLGSIMVHRGMIKLHNSTSDIADVLETVQHNTRTAAVYLHDEIDVNIESLKGSIEKMLVKDVSVKGSLETQLFFLKRNVSRCMRRVDDIYSRIERLNIRPIPDNVQLIEKIRWPGTFAFAFLLILFCFILLCGLCRHSRCTLIMFSVFGLLALVLGWVLSSLYLGILVAGSDFCSEPDSFLDDRFSNEAEMAILDYYIRCRLPQQQQQQQHHQQYDRNNYNNYNQQQQQNQQNNPSTFVNHPFRVQTRASLMALDHMSELIRALEMLCISYCTPDQSIVRPQINSIVQHLNSTERLLKSVQQLLDCRRIHEDYIESMSASCKDLLEGFFLLLITSALIGLIFTLLVLCASHTWIHIRTIQPISNQSNLISTQVGLSTGSSSLLGQLDNADETDPFLPSTPRNLNQQQQQSSTLHHHTILSNNSTSSSLTNTSLTAKRFRDSYGSAYGTTGRGRFSHTPPQTPHFTTLGGGGNNLMTTNLNQQQQQQLLAGGRRSEEQLSFLSPPPAYDQLNQQQQQQLHYQQQLQQQQQQQQAQQHSIYGGSLHHHHTGTLPHSHHHLQQQQQHQHHPTASIGHHHQQPLQHHHQSAIGHYVADPTDIMIRAPTQATKF